jgi:thioredoxin-like negative regulator of GroEL
MLKAFKTWMKGWKISSYALLGVIAILVVIALFSPSPIKHDHAPVSVDQPSTPAASATSANPPDVSPSTPEPALSPEAQQACDEGMSAAQQKQWDVAIRHFDEARQAAPHASKVIYDLGLAEAQVPGRELRAICWFEAYLALAPDAPNAADVRKEITDLGVKAEGDAQTLVDMADKLADQLPEETDQTDASSVMRDARCARNDAKGVIAVLRAEMGDIDGAEAVIAALPDNFHDADMTWMTEGLAALGKYPDAIKVANQIHSDTSEIIPQSVTDPTIGKDDYIFHMLSLVPESGYKALDLGCWNSLAFYYITKDQINDSLFADARQNADKIAVHGWHDEVSSDLAKSPSDNKIPDNSVDSDDGSGTTLAPADAWIQLGTGGGLAANPRPLAPQLSQPIFVDFKTTLAGLATSAPAPQLQHMPTASGTLTSQAGDDQDVAIFKNSVHLAQSWIEAEKAIRNLRTILKSNTP